MNRLLAPMTPEEAEARALESVWEDAREWVGASMERRAWALASVQRACDALVDQSPFRDRIRGAINPLSQEAELTWLGMVRRYRQR